MSSENVTISQTISEAMATNTADDKSAPVLREVVAHGAPYDYCHDRYQAYYAEGIRQYVEAHGGRFLTVNLTRFPNVQRRLRRLRSSHRLNRMLSNGKGVLRGIDALARAVGGSPGAGFHPLVGRYLFRFDNGRELKVCVDAADAGAIASDELLDWCDVYFKTNYWIGHQYPPAVVPLYNGNPLVVAKRESLLELRRSDVRWDVCFVVRVWGGDDEVGGIEHNLRLLEAVNRVKCRKFLLAYLVSGDLKQQMKRLQAQSIPYTTEPMRLAELWHTSACSRLSILRLGMHGCLPWRMTDVLAMGACPVLDQRPNTTWSPPFVEGENFLNLNAAIEPGSNLAADSAYEAIPAKLETFLETKTVANAIRARNATYFDECVSPEATGRQICQAVLASVNRST